jgi:UDPglucose 6-dehydrogenase
VCEASLGTGLAHHLVELGAPVIAYDPMAAEEARQMPGGGIQFASSAAKCGRESDVVVITVAWNEFRRLDPNVWRRHGKRPTVIDRWRPLEGRLVEANVIRLGLGPQAACRSASTFNGPSTLA